MQGVVNKEIKFGEEARALVCEGVNEISNAVKVTLGAKGKIVMIGDYIPRLTKDGVTVARSIDFADPYKYIGAKLVKDVAQKTCDDTGDGTTSATILTQSIINEGIKNLKAGNNPILLKKGIDIAVQEVNKRMSEASQECSSVEELTNVAAISANNDHELGARVAEAMHEIGDSGIITIGDSDTSVTTVEIIEGMKVDNGFISPYFINKFDTLESVLEDAYVLVTDNKVQQLASIAPIIEAVYAKEKPLFIIAGDVSGEALTFLTQNAKAGKISVCAIKAPSAGNNQKFILEDIATITGASMVSEDLGATLKDVTIANLGKANKIIIDRVSTVIIGGDGDESDMAERKAGIRNQIETATSPIDAGKLSDRLARIENGVGIIKVGGISDAELQEKKDRVEDAIGATRAAMQEGIGPGGGVMLALAAHGAKVSHDNPEVQIGIDIVLRACQEPLRQIAMNSAVDSGVVYNKVIESGLGFNAMTNEYVDMIENNIIDPVKVPKVALENAASVAGVFLSCEAVVVDTQEDKS